MTRWIGILWALLFSLQAQAAPTPYFRFSNGAYLAIDLEKGIYYVPSDSTAGSEPRLLVEGRMKFLEASVDLLDGLDLAGIKVSIAQQSSAFSFFASEHFIFWVHESGRDPLAFDQMQSVALKYERPRIEVHEPIDHNGSQFRLFVVHKQGVENTTLASVKLFREDFQYIEWHNIPVSPNNSVPFSWTIKNDQISIRTPHENTAVVYETSLNPFSPGTHLGQSVGPMKRELLQFAFHGAQFYSLSVSKRKISRVANERNSSQSRVMEAQLKALIDSQDLDLSYLELTQQDFGLFSSLATHASEVGLSFESIPTILFHFPHLREPTDVEYATLKLEKELLIQATRKSEFFFVVPHRATETARVYYIPQGKGALVSRALALEGEKIAEEAISRSMPEIALVASPHFQVIRLPSSGRPEMVSGEIAAHRVQEAIDTFSSSLPFIVFTPPQDFLKESFIDELNSIQEYLRSNSAFIAVPSEPNRYRIHRVGAGYENLLSVTIDCKGTMEGFDPPSP